MPRCRFAFGRRAKTWGRVEDLYALLGLKPTGETPDDLVKAAVTLILDLPNLDPSERSAFDEIAQKIGEADKALAGALRKANADLSVFYTGIRYVPIDLEGLQEDSQVDLGKFTSFVEQNSALVQLLLQLAALGSRVVQGVFNQRLNRYLSLHLKNIEARRSLKGQVLAVIYGAWVNKAGGVGDVTPLRGLKDEELETLHSQLDKFLVILVSDTVEIDDDQTRAILKFLHKHFKVKQVKLGPVGKTAAKLRKEALEVVEQGVDDVEAEFRARNKAIPARGSSVLGN